jgi:hypothetical protein
MTAALSLRKSLLVMAMFASVLSQARTHREFDILISPEQDGFFFFMNDNSGNGMIENPFANRVAGANYILNGEIFEKGTISKHQENFNEDRHGRNLPKPIGTFFCIANVTEDLAFTSQGFPEKGSVAELVTWEFVFRKSCDGENMVVAMGPVYAGEVESDESDENPVGFRAEGLPVVGTSGCNFAVPNTIEKAKAYLSPTGQILLVVRFQHSIEYQD